MLTVVKHYSKIKNMNPTSEKPVGEGKSPASERTRNWVFIAYPESLPPIWLERLKDFHVPFVVSPLHDRDINADGSLKKPHYHVVLSFNGVKSFEQVKEITDSLNASIPQKVANMNGQIRYLIHKDNPEKVQYSSEDILDLSMGKIDVRKILMSKGEELVLLKEIFSFIYENDIIEFTELVNYSMHEQEDWFSYLMAGHSWVVIEYIKSLRHGGKNYGRPICEGTGNENATLGRTEERDKTGLSDSAQLQENCDAPGCEPVHGSTSDEGDR